MLFHANKTQWLTWEDRFWFIENLSPYDYKAIPEDVDYQAAWEQLEENDKHLKQITFEQQFSGDCWFSLRAFDRNYNRLITVEQRIFTDFSFSQNDINIEIEYTFLPVGCKLNWTITNTTGIILPIFTETLRSMVLRKKYIITNILFHNLKTGQLKNGTHCRFPYT